MKVHGLVDKKGPRLTRNTVYLYRYQKRFSKAKYGWFT